MFKKLILVSLATIVLYSVGKFYMVMRWGNMVSDCGDYSVVSEIKKNSPPTAEQIQYSAEVWGCVKDKQTFIDALFFKIPEPWLKTPIN